MVVTLSLREKTFFVRIVCMLNESIDDLFWDTGRATSTKRREKRNIHLQEKRADSFSFLIIRPYVQAHAGGCKFSFTFF